MGKLVGELVMFFEGKEYIKISLAINNRLVDEDSIAEHVFSNNISIYYFANEFGQEIFCVCNKTLQSGYEARMADGFIKDCTIFDSDFSRFYDKALLKLHNISVDSLGLNGFVEIKGCYSDKNDILIKKLRSSLKVEKDYFDIDLYKCFNDYFTLFSFEDKSLNLGDFYVLKSSLKLISNYKDIDFKGDSFSVDTNEAAKGYNASLAIIHALYELAGKPSLEKISRKTEDVGRLVKHQAIRNRLNDTSFKK
jgi:hypothetical protein